jgi:hypothetical protein
MRRRSRPEGSPGHLTFCDGFQWRRRHRFRGSLGGSFRGSFGGSFPAIRPGAPAVQGSGPRRTAEEQSSDGSRCELLGIDVQSDSR